jgi:hypothetical protein
VSVCSWKTSKFGRIADSFNRGRENRIVMIGVPICKPGVISTPDGHCGIRYCKQPIPAVMIKLRLLYDEMGFPAGHAAFSASLPAKP